MEKEEFDSLSLKEKKSRLDSCFLKETLKDLGWDCDTPIYLQSATFVSTSGDRLQYTSPFTWKQFCSILKEVKDGP